MAITNVRKVLKSIDYSALDEKEKVNALKTTTSIVAMIPKLVKDLSEAEKAVNKEIEESGRARGGNQKTILEDGLDIFD